MALPIWPPSLPSAPQRDSYRVSEPFNANDITEFEAGNTRDRPRGSIQYRKIEQTLRMSQNEFAQFDAFVLNDLAKGSRRFLMPVWLGHQSQTRTVKLSGENKFALATRGRALMVTMTLEVEL